MLYWPIDDSANCALSSEVSKVLGATANGIRTATSLKPNACAVRVIRASPVSTPSFANTVLHDHSKASRSGASAQPSPSFVKAVVVPGSR